MKGSSVALFLIGAFLSLGLASCSSETNDPVSEIVVDPSMDSETYSSWPTDGPPEGTAKGNVKSFVLSQLVNPSSAKFGSMDCVKSRNAFKNENGSWEVKFWIEATNSFGATVRRSSYVFVDDSGSTINYRDVGSESNPSGILHSFGEREIESNARISK
ncbi:MAG: hypothetical protein HOH82_09720 [Planctomycetaceae bacterium]|jgi:hypothetical protein|nr:hypothetical protein [Planctomycetaceae bacterium]